MLRYLLILVLMLAACSDKKAVPPGILTEEQMVEQLTEYYVLEDKVVQLGVPADSSLRAFNFMSEKLTARTGIPDSVFRKSLQFYIENPIRLERIYGALVDSLNLREQRSSLSK